MRFAYRLLLGPGPGAVAGKLNVAAGRAGGEIEGELGRRPDWKGGRKGAGAGAG